MNRIVQGTLSLTGCLALGACAYPPVGLEGPSAPMAELAAPGPFQSADFAWSARGGTSSIEGVLNYRPGGERYVCSGGDVILTPETPWSRRRMVILYGGANSAAIPVSIVRARTPGAPSGDYARFVRKTTCDEANHFSFKALPEGSWFVITVAKPVEGAGESMAVTRRVETRGGPRSVTLQ